MSFQLNKVLIIGAGTMGCGIAQWFSQQGISTHLTDSFQEILPKAQERIFSSFDKLTLKGKFTTKQNQSFKDCIKTVSMSDIDSDYDLIIEAIIENLEIKKELFKGLDQKMDSKTIIASNTSSIPITTLCQGVSEKRRSQFLGLHFFNPATIMKLVEVISAETTDKTLSQDLYNWFKDSGKRPALCKDSPGFIVNRVARNFYGESLRIAKEDNISKIEETDKVLKASGGFKMGPFELLDLIGVDVNLDVTKSVWNSFDKNPRFAPHCLQEQIVSKGRFGRKVKKGFYSYE